MNSTLAKETLLIIPCAGNGTRLLPFSLSAPKEFMPVPNSGLTVPAVLDLIWKASDAGILAENIILVVSEEKLPKFREFFQTNREAFAEELAAKGKVKFSEAVQKIPLFKDEQFIVQNGPYGNATPLTSVANQLSGELSSFKQILYMFPDDLFTETGEDNDIAQMLAAGEKYSGGIFATKRVLSDEEYDKYGIVDGNSVAHTSGKVLKVNSIIEKPGKENATSDLASVSGYLLPIELFVFAQNKLARFDALTGEEFMIQPVIQDMINGGYDFFAVKIDGEYHDTGNFADFAKLWESVQNFSRKKRSDLTLGV